MRVGSVAQALTDTDADGMDDDWEIHHFGDLSQIDTGDFDSDEMTNGEEYLYQFNPTFKDSFEDADGDRYPNIFEIHSGASPNDSTSIPTPTFVVDAAGGGTHSTLSAAVDAAKAGSAAYQIIGIAPGVYSAGVTIPSPKPKLLVIGLEGAAKTIIDGGGRSWGWSVYNAAVISSLTFQRASPAIYVSAPTSEVRLVDLVVRDNAASLLASGVHVASTTMLHIVGSTFLNNSGGSTRPEQIYVERGNAAITNTVVWGPSTDTMLGKGASATLTASHSLVKGQMLPGTGNLDGSLDPKLRFDGHLLWDSPLRSAGTSVLQSRIDMNGEWRPLSAPDIGVDQFNDADGDEVADQWELSQTGGLTSLTDRAQDADDDGLSNDEEYILDTKATVADSDGDGLTDRDEVRQYETNPLKVDTDGDDMPDGWETTYGLAPLTADPFEDADGDRYPNVYEHANSTNPNDPASFPKPDFVVDAAGGGSHRTVSAAVDAARINNGAYQIIGLVPGVYAGPANTATLTPNKAKLLVIGLEGAAKTIIDGGGTNWGWSVYDAGVISSLTFQRTTRALYVSAPSSEVRLVDLLVKDNASSSYASGVHVAAASTVHIVGSTFLNNSGSTRPEQIYIERGRAALTNTVVWGQSTDTMLGKGTSATLATNHCFVRGMLLPGTGNIDGTLNPRLRSDGRLASDSPLRGAGGSINQSRIDIDGEPRPIVAPDMGVDQYIDADSDGLPDGWEISNYGNITSIGGASDEDNDGLSNVGEYDRETNLHHPDTDGDGVSDGVEVDYGLNPRVSDADDLAVDLNHDGILDGIGIQLGYSHGQSDNDGDSVSNAEEALICTDIFRTDSDGDGVPDAADAFPLDPRATAVPMDPLDVTPPTITLSAPRSAVPE